MKAKIKDILLTVATILVAVALLTGITTVVTMLVHYNSPQPIEVWEHRYGTLTEYTPRTSFKHFKLKDGRGIDFIYNSETGVYKKLGEPYKINPYYQPRPDGR